MGKGENAGNPQCFLLLSRTSIIILITGTCTLKLLSAKAFNLNQSKILSSGKGLNQLLLKSTEQLHIKFGNPTPYGFRKGIFKRFSILYSMVALAANVFIGIKVFEKFLKRALAE